ncbi:MAG: winged helix-turn-helix domain-containing protein [Acidobacteriota bacterium]|nr:winged helix-turn-helix domain-containing protein [Acidobacteriota bacterium]
MSNRVRLFYEFGPFRLDPDRHRLLRGGEVIPLPPKAIEALLVLVQNPGKPLEREALMTAVWADTFVEDANLTVAISNLRKALGQSGETAEYIETIPRLGYRFAADVRVVEEQLAPVVLEKHTFSRTVIEEETEDEEKDARVVAGEVSPVRAVAQTNPLPAGAERSSLSRTILAAAFGILLLTGAAVALYEYLKPGSRGAQPAQINSVAVLPLKNLTGDQNDEYLVDGLTESLINSLSKIEGLKVISRSSVFTFKAREVEPREVGKQLGVVAIIEGGVVKDKDSVHVSVRLVSTEDGRVLWAGDSFHSLSDVFAIEGELAHGVANSLRPELSKDEARGIIRHYTNNQEAYQLYLKGRYFWNKRTEADLRTAIDYFQRAIALDPGYAPAYAGLADSYAVISYYSKLPFEETFPKAEAAAEKAIEIDETLAEPHATLGLVVKTFNKDWARSEREFRRALELNPNYATAHHWYAFYLRDAGRLEEYVQEMRRALELDPASIAINVDMGQALAETHRPDEAIRRLEMALQMDQRQPGVFHNLALAYELKGNLQQSALELEEAIRLSGEQSYLMIATVARLGRVYGLMGRKDKALNMLARLNSMSRRAEISPYYFALVYAGLGENDEALTSLESACQSRSVEVYDLRNERDTYFATLRDEPRFQKVLKCVGLPQ